MSNGAASDFGSYFGRLILEPLPDGRRMRVVEDFGFLDPDRKRWPVPVGAKVDGASIPKPLWSVIGGPFEGKYRDASVVHDWYCDVRTEPWRAVHRVFYNAMRASGVSESLAKLMYAGVYWGGPRWSETTVDNARLGGTGRPTVRGGLVDALVMRGIVRASPFPGRPPKVLAEIESPSVPERQQAALELANLQVLIGSDNPSLDEIDMSIDAASDALGPALDGLERIRTLDVSGF